VGTSDKGNAVRDGDKGGNDSRLTGNDREFAGRPEFTTEGTVRDGTGEDGILITLAEEDSASARNNKVELIAFGDVMATV
jgi:hypothetical protein